MSAEVEDNPMLNQTFIQTNQHIISLMECKEIADPEERENRQQAYLQGLTDRQKDLIIAQLLDDVIELKLQQSMSNFRLQELLNDNNKRPPSGLPSGLKRTRRTSAQFYQQDVQNQIRPVDPGNIQPFMESSAAQQTIMSPGVAPGQPLRSITTGVPLLPNGVRIQSAINKQLQKKMISISKFRALQDQIQGYHAIKSIFLIQFEYLHPLNRDYRAGQTQYRFVALLKLVESSSDPCGGYFKLQYGDSEKSIQRITIQQLSVKQLVALERGGQFCECNDLSQAIGFW